MKKVPGAGAGQKRTGSATLQSYWYLYSDEKKTSVAEASSFGSAPSVKQKWRVISDSREFLM